MRSAQILTLIALVAWIYGPALHGGWLWDDNLYFARNSSLSDRYGLLKIWFVPGTLFEYYPVTETLQWVQWRLWGNNTLGYHLTNVCLHVVNACLFWRLLDKFGLYLAWIGAVLFAVHPINVESVAWISELKNTLSLAPALLCVIAFIDYEKAGDARHFWMAVAWFSIASLCKNSVVCLPFCLLLHVWWRRGRIAWSDLETSAPFFAISVLSTALTLWAASRYEWDHGSQVSAAIITHIDIAAFLALAVSAIFFYLAHYLYPFDLVAFYPPWSEDSASSIHLFQIGLLFAAALLLFRVRRTWGRNLILGLGFYVLNLLPIIGLIFARYPYFVWSLDHSAYLPCLGLFGLTVAGLESVYGILSARFRTVMVAALILLALPISIYSRSYASCFVDAKELWIYTLQHRASRF